MKSILVILASLLFGSVNSNAQFQPMGNEKGNGGGAFVCRNSGGEVISSTLVDMYEAKNQLGLNQIDVVGLNVKETLDKVYAKVFSLRNRNFGDVRSRFRYALYENIKVVQDKLRLVDNVVLANTNDFQISLVPQQCEGGTIKFEQLASYTPSNDLIVDREIYDHLSIIDQAALYIHEALYLTAREWYGAESSLESRWAVGYLFSDVDFMEIPESILAMEPVNGPPNRRWVCDVTFIKNGCLASYGCTGSFDKEFTSYGISKGDAARSYLNESREIRNEYTACLNWNFKSEYSRLNDGTRQLRWYYTCHARATPDNVCFQQF